MAQRRGFAPLAARPAGQLSIAHFAVKRYFFLIRKAKRSFSLAAPPSNPLLPFFNRKQKEHTSLVCSFVLAQRRGFAPLAARPAGQLSIAHFAVKRYFFLIRKAKRSFSLAAPPSNPLLPFFNRKQKEHTSLVCSFVLAQRRGFEPPVRFRRTHDFQSCSLNHSDISAFCRHFA